MIKYKSIKKNIDFFIALILLILFIPLFIFISMGVLIFNGKPIFFTQIRPGLNNKCFKLYKFRTMSNSKNLYESSENDHLRLTKFGKFLRKTSIDELPSLINIIRGEMSFVGPRPLLVEYLKLYNEFQSKRHKVKPGITGLAQVQGRNNLSWEDKFSKDIYYVENYNFQLDLKIIILTIFEVIKRNGINSPGEATCKSFGGNK
tara:strand:+ start:4391 stop:4999 length:609 start_codon:yes stop_codon:yes gene_type:complete